MGIEKLIQVVAVIAVLAVSSHELPRFLWAVRGAQALLIQESQSSKWGRAMLLP
jgi:hypothetical protein